MEKFSKWRDPGTGIQPFLPPVPAHTPDSLQLYAYKTVAAVGAVSRCVLLGAVAVLYLVLVDVPLRVLSWSPTLSSRITRIPNAILCRLALFLMGYWWITTEIVQIKRVRGNPAVKVEVKPGDLIVSNWTGYIDVLYLAYRFNPTFLLPIHEPLDSAPQTASNVPSTSQPPAFIGYTPVLLPTLLSLTGHTPSSLPRGGLIYRTIAEARAACPARPLVVFPEGTTSNARGLLRFSRGCLGDVEVPVKGYNVWVLYFKHPSPTAWTSTATHSTPSQTLNPLPHVLSTCATLLPRGLGVRILHPYNAPSSGAFLPSETLATAPTGTAPGGGERNVLGECVAVLVAGLGRVKSVGLGWEDKDGFLEFARGRRAVAGRVVSKGRGEKAGVGRR